MYTMSIFNVSRRRYLMNRNQCYRGSVRLVAGVFLSAAMLVFSPSCSSGSFDISGNPSDIGGAQDAIAHDTLPEPDHIEIYDIFNGSTFSDSCGGLLK